MLTLCMLYRSRCVYPVILFGSELIGQMWREKKTTTVIDIHIENSRVTVFWAFLYFAAVFERSFVPGFYSSQYMNLYHN